MIENKLEKIGFNPKEIEIYLIVYRYKHILPATIAYLSKINRTTVYSLLKVLIEKNLISEEIRDGKKEIICLPTENLNNLIYKEKIELDKKEKIVSEIISDLQKLDNSVIQIPEVKTITHDNIEAYLYSNFEKWNKSSIQFDSTWWGFQDNLFPYEYIDWIDYIWKESPNNIFLKLFSDNSEVEKNIGKKFERREVIFSENMNDFDGTIWVIGDYIINIYLRNKPHYMNEVYNPILAKNLRKVFKTVWKQEQKK